MANVEKLDKMKMEKEFLLNILQTLNKARNTQSKKSRKLEASPKHIEKVMIAN